MKINSTSPQAAELEDLLQQSAHASSEGMDTHELQQRIIERTQAMPQQRSRGRFSFLGGASRSPWSNPWPGLALAACGVVLVATVLMNPLVNQYISPETTPTTELVLLTEDELNNDSLAYLVWDEVLLLEDELAFGTL